MAAASRIKKQTRTEGAQWKTHSSTWRDSLDVSTSYRPWTSSRVELKAVPATDRVKDLMDCVVADKGRKDGKGLSAKAACQEVKIKDVILDISQSHQRPTFTDNAGVLPTMTTGSHYYSFRADSMLASIEHLMLQGHPRSVTIPESLKPADVRALAGEGMALPSLATAIWAWFMVANAKNMVVK